MSGGSKAPNSPDLSGNVSTANNTAASATDDATQTYNTANAYNQNAQDTLSQVNGANTPLMGQVNSTAAANMSQYQNNFLPLQQQQIQQAQQYGSDQNIENLQGQATADSNASVQASINNQRASLASEGVDPASIGGSAITQQAGVQGAALNAQAANASRTNTVNTANQLTSNANQLGMQVGQAGTTGAQAGSSIGTGMVSNENSTNATGVNNLTAANPYLATATNANQSGANISNTQFQDQLTSQQAQAAASNSNWAAVGTIGGIALGEYANSEKGGGGMEEGGVVGYPKPVMQHVGALPWQQRQPGQPLHFDGGGAVPMYDTGFNSTGMGGGFNEMGGGITLGGGGMPQNMGGASTGQMLGVQQNFANAGNWDQQASPVQPTQALPSYANSGAPAAGPTSNQSYASFAPTAFGANVQGFANGFEMTQGGGSAGATGISGGSGGMAGGGIVSSRGALPTSPIPGSTDTKPAWLTPGEFVIPHDAASWKGHEHWFKEIDKARAGIAQRHGLPPPASSALTVRGS